MRRCLDREVRPVHRNRLRIQRTHHSALKRRLRGDKKRHTKEEDPLAVDRERRIEDTALLERNEKHPSRTRERLL
jgi:hypothetical protein